jgi:predicted enzyme related to lactoylglutathione lyase
VTSSPIENRVGAVFVPVSDMDRAIRWFSELLGLPVRETSHGGKIYDVETVGDVGIILDGHREVVNSSQPLFFLMSRDSHAARRHLQVMGAPGLGDVQDIGSMWTLPFCDPDGNRLMVCQRKAVT